MEDWQKTHIEKNLPVLIDITTCSVGLKARLRAKELLTKEEDERLAALARNHGLICEAKMLYDIMMTRQSGYNGLMEVLRDTRQDGAFKILQDGLQLADSQFPSGDYAIQLMNMRVQLANCTKSFNDMFPRFTMDDARELVRNADIKKELEELLQKSLEIKLDGGLPLTSDLYLPRLLSNRLQLNPKIFTLDSCEDVFVFTNISRMELAQLVKPHPTRSSTGQRSLVTGRHIYLDDEEDWDDMVAVSESPIHLVSKEDGGYILQRTSKVTDVLQNYALREARAKEAFVTEDAFVKELLSNSESKGALICDVAAMGKTWLMQSLAAKIRDKSENFVTFFLELSSFGKYLTRLDQMTPYNQALTTVLTYASSSKLGSNLLQNYAAQNGLKIVFVLDGYDEIMKDDIEVVKSNLEVLSKFDHIRMIISSRPNMRAVLQNTFTLIAYDMLPFQTEQQVHCIVNQWVKVRLLPDSELCKLDGFARQCIKSVKSIQKDAIHDILGVPLQCRILATINEKPAYQLCKANRRRPIQVVEAAIIKSVFDLYTMFVNCLVDKVAETTPLHTRTNFANGIVTFYTHMALEVLFPDLSILYLQNYKIDFSMEELFSCVGLASVNHVSQRLEFIHRTFAEYFVGRFFAEFWNDIEQFSPSFVHVISSCFIRNVMIAVDGAFKIHPDPSKQSNAWWDLIKYEPWFSGNFSYFLNNKKVFHLKYPLILLFMNLNLKVKKPQVVSISFEHSITTTTPSLQPCDYRDELCGLKKWLAESAFATMMACIDERLTNIFSLYVKILTSFFDTEHRVALLLPNAIDQNRESRKSAAWLLCRAAMSKSPENAVELFNLFGDSEENFISLLCRRYPQEYWSPIEVAIITEDVDMILYFVDKVSLPFSRLFFTCVGMDLSKELPSSKIDVKQNIMKIVLESSHRVMDFLCTDNLHNYKEQFVTITKYSFQLLVKFVEESMRSINSISGENKRWILKKCLNDCNDKEFVNLLLSLYERSENKILSTVNRASNDSFSADQVLEALDLIEVQDAFSKVEMEFSAFSNCLELETLKVLTAIQPDFTCWNQRKWNYMHLAASALNIDWLKHLIHSGYEVDQLDAYGCTPLLCVDYNGTNNPKSMLAITRLLVEKGANIYAKDGLGRNIVHCVFSNCRNADIKDLCEWVSYTLDNGYNQLWEMKDEIGNTPREVLIYQRHKHSNPVAAHVLRLLESYL